MSRDDNQTVPRAVTSLTDWSYVGDKYPNTTENIDNSASSVRNAFTSKDVIWYKDVNGGGGARCLNHGTQVDDLGWGGFGDDDQFSSHVVSTQNLCN